MIFQKFLEYVRETFMNISIFLLLTIFKDINRHYFYNYNKIL